MTVINRSTVSLLRRVYSHLTVKRRRQLALLSVLMIISSFIEALSISSIVPFLAALATPEKVFEIEALKYTLNYLGINDISSLRLFFTMLFIGMVIISGIFRIAFFWFQTRLSMAIGIDFSVQVYEKTLYQPYGDLVSRNSSEILAGAQKAKDLVGYIIQPTLTFLSSIFMLVVVLGALFAVEPIVALSSIFGFGSLYILVTILSKRFLQANSRTYATEMGRVNKLIQEGIGGIRDVIIDGTQSIYSGLYKGALSRMQYAAAGNAILAQSPRFVIEMLVMVIFAGITFVMIERDVSFVSMIPVLGVIALGAQRMLPVLQQAYAAYASIRGGADSTLDVLSILELEQTVSSGIVTSLPNHVSFEKTLRVENLSFSYRGDSKMILNNINFEIKQGERVGLIGATGSGKSTLVDIVMGLLHPTNGAIYVDGNKLCSENIRDWQSCISHVPQSIYLADTTIAENIAFGVEPCEIDMDRVREASNVAQISQTIESFSDSYQTYVGERGIRLSGGQLQRIGMARAIYKGARVLILDEATSALDGETESSVMSAIDGLEAKVTMLIIAHRMATLQNCNFIIELKDGVVTWVGTYQELKSKKKELMSFG